MSKKIKPLAPMGGFKNRSIAEAYRKMNEMEDEYEFKTYIEKISSEWAQRALNDLENYSWEFGGDDRDIEVFSDYISEAVKALEKLIIEPKKTKKTTKTNKKRTNR